MMTRRFLLVALAVAPSVLTSVATVRYVDVSSANPTPPFLDWSTAATNIQDAVDVAAAGDEVVVTNGLYASGGRATGTNLLVNRVLVDKPISLRSVNGPQATTIQGNWIPWIPGGFAGCGEGAVRGVSLASGASLSGFTLVNGATRTDGDPELELSGGGVWCESASAVVSNCVLLHNGAWYGGGDYGGTLTHCLLTNNTARSNGGGAYRCNLNDCTLSQNSSRLYNGGGAYGGTLSGCILAGNFASAIGGGACNSTLQNCILTNNTAGVDGGGAGRDTGRGWSFGDDGTLSMLSNCVLIGNTAQSGGGASYSTLRECVLTGNSTTSGGGGASHCTLTNCSLTANSTSGAGGGADGSSLWNCLLAGNWATNFGGGSYFGMLQNCTLAGNASGSGGGTYEGSLNNCIVVFNTATTSGENYHAFSGTLNYCCTTPLPQSGVGNLACDPLFVDTNSWGNLRLQSSSPCINAGRNADVRSPTDLDGNPRIVGGTVDMGAYECQSPVLLGYYNWLEGYSLSTMASLAYVDTDLDGLNNWQEWRAATSPTNALSRLALLTPENSPSGVAVTWESVPTRSYFVERGTDLAQVPMMLTLATNIPGQPERTTFTDSTATNGGPFFYRVGVQ